MSQVGKASLLADLSNILVCFHEFPLRVHNPRNINILNNRAVGIAFKFPAKIIGAYVKMPGELFQLDILLIMSVDIADYLPYSVLRLRRGGLVFLSYNRKGRIFKSVLMASS